MAGIYIHIPFCKQACSYCNFHFSTKRDTKTELLSCIKNELISRRSYLDNEPIKSIYLGGGTPSLLNAVELNELVGTIEDYFSVDNTVEITLEANPDDLCKDYLKTIKDSKINRLSIGIQSFHNEDLKFMHRAHNRKQAIESLENAINLQFNNINVDLIFGSPTTSNQMWEENLNIFGSFGIQHLSAYSLTIENKTLLQHQIKTNQIPAPDESVALRHYETLQCFIVKNGFEQYEVSNYCKSEQYAVHNSNYWLDEKYLGIGPSAHSYNGNSRQWNISNNNAYIKKVKNNDPYHQIELLSEIDKYNEYLINSLRTKWGINILKLSQKFSDKIVNHFNKQVTLLSANLVSLTKDQLLVKKEKLFQSDEIVRHLMMEV